MSLTYSGVNANAGDTSIKRRNFGDLFGVIVDITGDSSYPSGGYAINQASLHLTGYKILGMQFLGWPNQTAPSTIRNLSFDPTNLKLQFNSSVAVPAMIVEESVTITSNAGRLARVPGPIIAVQATAGSVTGAFRVIPNGKTPATKQVSVNLATGALATFATDAVTTLLVTYIPLGVGQFTAANLVVDEAHTFTTGGANLANRAAFIQYVWNDTDTTHLPTFLPSGQAPATHQIAVNFVNSTNTTITPNSAQNTNTGLVTYFKYSTAFVDVHGWRDTTAITISSTTLFSFGKDLAVPPNGIWMPALGNVIIGETSGGAANLQAVLEGPSGTAAANVAVYDPITGKIVLLNTDAYVTLNMPYMLLATDTAVPTAGEAQAGSNLSGIKGRCLFYAA